MVKTRYRGHNLHPGHKGGVLYLEQHFGVNRRENHLVLVKESSSLSDIIAEAEQQGYIPDGIYATSQSSDSPVLTNGHIACKKIGEIPGGRQYGIITSERVKPRSYKDILYCFYIVEPNSTPTDSQADKSL